jgi:hypothetical protein
MMQPLSYSALLLQLFGNQMHGLPERDGQGQWWNRVNEFVVPKEMRIREEVDDLPKAYAEMFGKPAPRGLNGFVGWYMDEAGPLATVVTGKNPSPELLKHEERHADGWLHPSQQMLRSLMGTR